MTTGNDDIEPRAPAQQEEIREESEAWDTAKGGEPGQQRSHGGLRRWFARFRR